MIIIWQNIIFEILEFPPFRSVTYPCLFMCMTLLWLGANNKHSSSTWLCSDLLLIHTLHSKHKGSGYCQKFRVIFYSQMRQNKTVKLVISFDWSSLRYSVPLVTRKSHFLNFPPVHWIFLWFVQWPNGNIFYFFYVFYFFCVFCFFLLFCFFCFRAAESVAAQQRCCELSKGLVSPARML